MILYLQNMHINKISMFLLATQASWLNDNEIAQEVVRSCPDNFLLLWTSLRKQFQQNNDVKEDR